MVLFASEVEIYSEKLMSKFQGIPSTFIFDMFLEKTKLKDDSSNDADWVRVLPLEHALVFP